MADSVRTMTTVVMSAIAMGTVVTHLALIFGISFQLYAWIVTASILVVVALVTRLEFGEFAKALRTSPAIAVTMGVSGSLAALAAVFFRVEFTDDYMYIPNAVYYVGHPEEALSFAIHFVELANEPAPRFRPGATMPIALLQGVVAYFLNLPVLDVYHVLSPILFGFFQPLVWFFLLTRFGLSNRAAAFGAVVICLCIPLMGETYRTYGNYGLNRFSHGKAIVMSLGLPLYAGLTIDFLGARTRGAWLRLFVCATALTGLATTTVLLVPLLSLLLASAAAVAFPRRPSETARLVTLYGLSQWYVVAFGLVFFYLGGQNLESDSTINKGWPVHFIGHARFVLLGSPKTSLILMLASLLGSLCLISGWPRRFIAVWFLLGWLAFLNPIVAPFLIEHLTTANVYWRLFYILPFPLTLGLLSAAAAERFGVGLRLRGNLIAVALIALLVSVHGVPESSSILNHGTRLKPGYKIKNKRLLMARKIIEVTPPGTMLSPEVWSGVIPMLSPDHPQIVALGKSVSSLMSKKERVMRKAASRFLDPMPRRVSSRESLPGPEILLGLFNDHPDLRSVVVRYPGTDRDELAALLQKKGFTEHTGPKHWQVYWRPAAWYGQDPGPSR